MSTENPIQIVEEKLNQWDLIQKSKEEKIETLRPLLTQSVLGFATSGDGIEAITVHEDLYEAVSAVLGEMSLPEDFKDGSGLEWSVVNEHFKTLCKSIPVKSAPTGYFAQYPAEQLKQADPLQLFVSFMTQSRRELSAIYSFDAKYGISQALMAAGIGFQPTPQEMRMLCLIAAVFAEQGSATQMDQKAILQATAGPNFDKLLR